jgi:hypothetical protein
MKIREFYVIPESKEDEVFIEQEMDFLLDVSLRRRREIQTKENYEDLILRRMGSWRSEAVSFG